MMFDLAEKSQKKNEITHKRLLNTKKDAGDESLRDIDLLLDHLEGHGFLAEGMLRRMHTSIIFSSI